MNAPVADRALPVAEAARDTYHHSKGRQTSARAGEFARRLSATHLQECNVSACSIENALQPPRAPRRSANIVF